MEDVLRIQRTLSDLSSSGCRIGILSDGEKEWQLGFGMELSEVECYRMAVGFARRVRNLVRTTDTGIGEYNYKMPKYLHELSLVCCCEELEQLELTFCMKGSDA